MEELDYSANILIVTIDPAISGVLGLLLNNLNYKIELTNSGNEAFNELKENKFDLMLLDMVLPDMNVFQVLNYVKTASPETLAVIMAGDVSSEKIMECLKIGAYDYFRKPFNKEEILKRIENALQQKKTEKEIKNINASLQITEKRNQYIIQNSEDIIYTLDYEGKFTSINESLQQKLGYENNYLLRKHYSIIIYPEDIEKSMFVFNERRAASRDTRSTKIRLKKYSNNSSENNTNEYITVEVKAQGIYDHESERNGKLFLGTCGLARDVTDYIKNEEVLKLQKSYFRELFNNSSEAIVILDNSSRILNSNKSFENLFQYSQKELRNSYIYDLILPEDMSDERDVPIGSIFVEKESVRKCKDGSYIDVLINAYPIEYNNKYIGAYHIYRNIADIKRNEEELIDQLCKVRLSMGNISNAIVSTVEVRDPYTVGHQQRVSNLARAIAQEMNLPKDDIDALRMAGTMHDLGKVNIPAEILSKPGHLTNIELNLVKMHPSIAYEILRKIEFPWPIAEIVYQHHERLDGSGYPRGLKGNNILLTGKILSVADVVESIASHRPYRPALGIRKALEEISSKKNIYYDARVVDTCIKLFYEKNFSFESDIPEENEPAYNPMSADMLPN